MNATKENNTTATRITTLSTNMLRYAHGLVQKHNEAVANLELECIGRKNRALMVSTNAIARELRGDTSELGVAMRDMLISIRENGNFVTDNPFKVKGLMELQTAKLIDTYVAPSSLWVDVDTYETDPTTYTLTPVGRKVAELLAVCEVRREEFRGAPDSD